MDFIYDALDLRRTGLEYVTGTFHDIGKMILAELFPFAFFSSMNRSLNNEIPLAQAEREMFKITHAEIAAQWMRENDLPGALVDAVARHESGPAVSKRATLTHALISVNHLVKQLGIGYSGNAVLDPHPWEEHPSTYVIWEARGNRDYEFEEFASDILNQFVAFPELT
jgi:HD-like signal output (HDOD) protein